MAAGLGLTALGACGDGSHAGVTAAEPVASDDRPNHAASAAWLGVAGAARASAEDDGLAPPRIVLSDPVDVTAPGRYTLRAGPVDEALAPTSFAVSLPPDLERYVALRVDRGPEGVRLVDAGGQRYLEVSVTVSEVHVPYAGLRAWLQWDTEPLVGTEAAP